MGWIWHEVFLLGNYGHDNPSQYYNITQESKHNSVFKPSVLFVSELSGGVFNRNEIKKIGFKCDSSTGEYTDFATN